MNISLVIPAYNEEARLPEFLRSVVSYAEQNKDITEIIVVDDGSTDKTAEIVESTFPSVRLVKLNPNQGKGAAIQKGVLSAAGDYVVFTDADGATPIDEMPKMIKALQTHDIGIGNRWLSGAHVRKSTALRHFAGWLNKTYMSLFGLGDIDVMCGFKGYKKSVAVDLFTNLIENRWLFDTEIAYKAVRRNYSIENFPIEWESKDGSKLDTATLIKSGFQVLPLILKIRKNG